jgi:hypothetical protein
VAAGSTTPPSSQPGEDQHADQATVSSGASSSKLARAPHPSPPDPASGPVLSGDLSALAWLGDSLGPATDLPRPLSCNLRHLVPAGNGLQSLTCCGAAPPPCSAKDGGCGRRGWRVAMDSWTGRLSRCIAGDNTHRGDCMRDRRTEQRAAQSSLGRAVGRLVIAAPRIPAAATPRTLAAVAHGRLHGGARAGDRAAVRSSPARRRLADARARQRAACTSDHLQRWAPGEGAAGAPRAPRARAGGARRARSQARAARRPLLIHLERRSRPLSRGQGRLGERCGAPPRGARRGRGLAARLADPRAAREPQSSEPRDAGQGLASLIVVVTTNQSFNLFVVRALLN